jgi:hypothetical protein
MWQVHFLSHHADQPFTMDSSYANNALVSSIVSSTTGNFRGMFAKLDDNNSSMWLRNMKYHLITQGLWEADATNVNGMKALAEIALGCTDSYKLLLDNCDSGASGWAVLSAHFTQRSKATLLPLQRQFRSLQKADNEALTQYWARAIMLQQLIKSAGGTISEQELLSTAMTGLPSLYDSVADTMSIAGLTAGKDFTMQEALNMLLPVEQREKAKSPSNSAFAAYGQSKKTIRCHFCRKLGHVRRDCLKLKAKNEDDANYAGHALVL